jgi:hypothetical protein
MGEESKDAPSRKYSNYGLSEFMTDKNAYKETIEFLRSALVHESKNIRFFTLYVDALEARYRTNSICASKQNMECEKAKQDTLLLTKNLIKWINTYRSGQFDFSFLMNTHQIFKYPSIQKMFEGKTKAFRNGGYHEDNYNRYNDSYYNGGQDSYHDGGNYYDNHELDLLRADIGRPQYNVPEYNMNGGKINNLREEILNLVI